MDRRVSNLPCIGGEKAVICLLPRKNPYDNIQNLGFSKETLSIYQTWLWQAQGMSIVTTGLTTVEEVLRMISKGAL